MLRFTLNQVHLASKGRFLLPLPKLGSSQIVTLLDHLEEKGFRVSSKSLRAVALRKGTRITIDGRVGLATSSTDMLDALGPAIPELLESRGRAQVPADATPWYASIKRSRGGVDARLFPRMESSATWTALRREGLCGLTPDEVAVIRAIADEAQDDTRVECVTATPREGSKALQVGRRVYYRSRLPLSEFLSGLRTTVEDDKGCYLPRESALHLPRSEFRRLEPDMLGEWFCF